MTSTTAPRPIDGAPPGGGRLGALGPVVVALVLLVALTGAALVLSRAHLRTAMDERVADRLDVVQRLSAGAATGYAAEAVAEKARSLPFSATDAAANVPLMQSFITTQEGDAPVAVLVVDRDGAVVGGHPAPVALPPSVAEDVLAGTSAGRIELSASFELDGSLVWARGYPIDDGSWGALVVVEPLTDGWLQRLYERMGALGPGAGGMTVLDRSGVVVASWDAARLGSRPLSARERQAVTAAPRIETVELGGRRTVRIAVVAPEGADGGVRFFEQPEETFFADLRRAQQERDRGVVAAAVVAVLALAAFGWLRQRGVRRDQARSTAILRHAGDVVMVVGDDGVVRSTSPAAEAVLGLQPSSISGRPLRDLVEGADQDAVASRLREVRSRGAATVLGVRLRTGTDDEAWFDLSLADRRDDPHIAGILVSCHEVGVRKRLEDELAHRAGHDSLTGLANRARFDEVLAERVASGRPLAVLAVDLDRFKQLNDEMGHAAGDAALVAVAGTIRRLVRDGDLVARLGGDEFGLIVGAGDDVAATLAGRIVEGVRGVHPAGVSGKGIDASVGIAVCSGRGLAPGEISRAADAAMYRAKRAGGGRAVSVLLEGSLTTGVAGSGVGAAGWPSETLQVPEPAEGGGGTVARAVPEPAAAGGRHPCGFRGRLRDAAVVVTAGSIVVAVVAAGFVHSGHQQRTAEARRIAERADFLEQVADIAASTTDPEKLVPVTAALPWETDSPELLEHMLREYATSPSLGPNGMSALLTAEGRIVASYPIGAQVAVDTGDRWWAGALEGRAYTPRLRDEGGVARFYFVVPVVREGEPVERVLVTGASIPDTTWSYSLEAVGALRPGPGGVSIVDEAGTTISSWDSRLLGQPNIEPDDLRGIGRGERRVLREVVDGEEQITIAVPVPLDSSNRYALWRQSASGLFGDLRAGRVARDGTWFGLVVVVVVGLAVVNRRRERALLDSAERLDALLQQAAAVVLVVDRHGVVRFASAAVERLLGRSPSDVVGFPLEDLVGGALEDRFGTVLDLLATSGRATAHDVGVVAADGAERRFDVDLVDLHGAREVGGVLLTCYDTTERTLLQQRLREQATRDPLTGLVNRAGFGACLDDLAAQPAAARRYAVAFLDLDRFKPVNDRFGHHAGDELLRVVAGRLAAAVRPGDVVARLGGDEFAVLLFDCDEDEAGGVAERLLAAVRAPVVVAGVEVAVDASVGVALSLPGIDHPEQLVREADQAMYDVKRRGRGGYTVRAGGEPADVTLSPSAPPPAR